jgi:hypothetical protein
MFEELKGLINQPEFNGLTDDQIIQRINTQDQRTPERLTKTELTSFFANNAIVEVRLRRLTSTLPAEADQNAVAVWGLATAALRLVDQPGVEYSDFENIATPLQILRNIGVLSEAQYATLLDLTTTPISRAEQSLGRLAEPNDLAFARLL